MAVTVRCRMLWVLMKMWPNVEFEIVYSRRGVENKSIMTVTVVHQVHFSWQDQRDTL